jgi:hypothetical protein
MAPKPFENAFLGCHHPMKSPRTTTGLIRTATRNTPRDGAIVRVSSMAMMATADIPTAMKIAEYWTRTQLVKLIVLCQRISSDYPISGGDLQTPESFLQRMECSYSSCLSKPAHRYQKSAFGQREASLARAQASLNRYGCRVCALGCRAILFGIC